MSQKDQLVHEMSEASDSTSWMSQATDHPLVRGFLLFAAFRAVYGMGVLIVTYFLVTSEEAPWWTSIVFLGISMVFSRLLFRALKRRWPHVFNKEPSSTTEAN